MYCKKPYHTKESCWKLHGKPQGVGRTSGFRGRQKRGQTHSTNVEKSPQCGENLSCNVSKEEDSTERR